MELQSTSHPTHLVWHKESSTHQPAFGCVSDSPEAPPTRFGVVHYLTETDNLSYQPQSLHLVTTVGIRYLSCSCNSHSQSPSRFSSIVQKTIIFWVEIDSMSRPVLPATPCLPPSPRLPPASNPPQGLPLPQGIHDPFKWTQAYIVQVTSLSTFLQLNILPIPLHLLHMFNKSLHLNTLRLAYPKARQWHLKDISSLRSLHARRSRKRSERTEFVLLFVFWYGDGFYFLYPSWDNSCIILSRTLLSQSRNLKVSLN